jgi:hypothetical protein
MRPFLLLLAAAALSCSHLRQSSRDKTLCAESRELVCLTAPDCTMDEARGCRVCQCSTGSMSIQPEDYGRPPGAPRDRNP